MRGSISSRDCRLPYNPNVSKEPYLSLIIPAYNEAARLPRSLEQVNAFVEAQSYACEVLVIENGSRDDTYQVAQSFARNHPVFRVEHRDQAGKGGAVQQGMLSAKGEFRMMLDADLSMPVSEISRFLPPQQPEADVVIASREAPGAVRYDEPNLRHIGGRVVNIMIRLLALPRLHDTQCGFKCFRAAVAEDLFSQQTIDGWAFDVEVLYIARLRGYRVIELPVPWYYSPQSHVKPVQDTIQVFKDILKIRSNARKGLYGRSS